MHRRHTKSLGSFNRTKTQGWEMTTWKIWWRLILIIFGFERSWRIYQKQEWSCCRDHMTSNLDNTKKQTHLHAPPRSPCLCPVACTLHPWYSHDPSYFLRLHALVMMMMMMMMMMMRMRRRRRSRRTTTRIVLFWDDERGLNFMYVGHTIPKSSSRCKKWHYLLRTGRDMANNQSLPTVTPSGNTPVTRPSKHWV